MRRLEHRAQRAGHPQLERQPENSGCLPPERDWLNGLCGAGDDKRSWVDSYRALHPEAQDYTWWSNRGAAYANNVGWRIDYQLVTPELATRLQGCSILREPRFSDHAPYTVDYAGTLA